jgi:hypothetical protein
MSETSLDIGAQRWLLAIAHWISRIVQLPCSSPRLGGSSDAPRRGSEQKRWISRIVKL